MAKSKEEKRAYYREWRAKNAEYVKQSKKDYYEKNRDRLLDQYRSRYRGAEGDRRRAMSREYYHRNAEKCRAYRRSKNRYHKLRAIGITEEQFQAQLERQGGVCAICKGLPRGRYKKFAADHCHTRGHFRGVLCPQCNSAIGLMKDDPQRLANAIDYLRKTESGSYATSNP